MTQTAEWTLRAVAKKAKAVAQSKGWHEKRCSEAEALALIHSEISEALEELRNGRSETDVYYEDGKKPCGYMIELMDAMFRILERFAIWGVDPDEMATLKMNYNETRPYRHGGKKL